MSYKKHVCVYPIVGPHGIRSVHLAVDNLKSEQNLIFCLFILGVLLSLASNVLLVHSCFDLWVSVPSTTILTLFGLAALLYSLIVAVEMRLVRVCDCCFQCQKSLQIVVSCLTESAIGMSSLASSMLCIHINECQVNIIVAKRELI